jgi:hypothetical protein
MNKRSFVLGFCVSLLFGGFPAVVSAQNSSPAAATTSTQGTKSAKQAIPQVSVVGSIQEILRDSPAGAPKGFYVVVAGPQGVISVNLGPWLSSAAKQSFSVGQAIQLTGTVSALHGQNYLMAHNVAVNNQQLTIRNENGALARNPSGSTSGRQKNDFEAKGENQ